MKKIFLLLILIVCSKINAQTYDCATVSIGDASIDVKAEFLFNEKDSTIQAKFTLTEKFKVYHIISKSTNGKIFKISDGKHDYFLYVISAKEFTNEPLCEKHAWLIQVQTSEEVYTYYCDEQTLLK